MAAFGHCCYLFFSVDHVPRIGFASIPDGIFAKSYFGNGWIIRYNQVLQVKRPYFGSWEFSSLFFFLYIYNPHFGINTLVWVLVIAGIIGSVRSYLEAHTLYQIFLGYSYGILLTGAVLACYC